MSFEPAKSTSAIAILQPHLANSAEIARPIPFPPPVTYKNQKFIPFSTRIMIKTERTKAT